MVAAVALMVLTACNKEEVAGGNPADNQTPATVEFSASFADTKTTLNNEGKKTLWVETDRIDINGQEFKIKELVDDGLSAIFENVNELPVGFAAPFTATYPYGKTEVPATQTAIAGTFDPAAVLETANSNDHNLSFTNVTSLLKFQVPAACQTVTISSDDDLAGSSAKTVTVNGPFAAGETYYAAVLPGTKANFVVRIDGYLSKNAASVTIAESTIANMQTLPAPVESPYKLMGINGDWSTGISFYNDIDGYYVLKNINILSSNGFKFRKDENIWGRPITFAKGKWAYTYDFPSEDFKITSGTYDIWVSTSNDAICFVDAGEEKPSFENSNKLIHILYEATGNCGLYIQTPSVSENDYNNSGAWNNYKSIAYMKKNDTDNQNYCAFPLPSSVVGKSCKFTIRVWGDKNKTYTMTITDDTPFWGNSDSGGSYTLDSKIDI